MRSHTLPPRPSLEFADFYRAFVRVVWRATAAERRRDMHQARRCPQGDAVVPNSEVLCADCQVRVDEILLLLHAEAATATKTGRAVDERWIEARAGSRYLDARDRAHGDAGLLQRPERLEQRAWFAEALPDPVDRRLVIEVTWWVRGNDMGDHSGLLPLDRLAVRIADAFGLDGFDAHEAQRRYGAAVTALGATAKGADFVERNIHTPLSRRLAGDALLAA